MQAEGPKKQSTREPLMKNSWKFVLVVSATICTQQLAFASGWIRGLDITSLGENNFGGEVVQLTVREEIDSSVRCQDNTGYAIRDSATLRGSLALLTSAMVAQRKVDLFLTGTCDVTGMPNVIGVILH
jgi:hypothetical protein